MRNAGLSWRDVVNLKEKPSTSNELNRAGKTAQPSVDIEISYIRMWRYRAGTICLRVLIVHWEDTKIEMSLMGGIVSVEWLSNGFDERM